MHCHTSTYVVAFKVVPVIGLLGANRAVARVSGPIKIFVLTATEGTSG